MAIRKTPVYQLQAIMNASVLREVVVQIQKLPFVERPMPLVQDTDTDVNRR